MCLEDGNHTDTPNIPLLCLSHSSRSLSVEEVLMCLLLAETSALIVSLFPSNERAGSGDTHTHTQVELMALSKHPENKRTQRIMYRTTRSRGAASMFSVHHSFQQPCANVCEDAFQQ